MLTVEQEAIMGRVIKREVVALRCELRSCESFLWLAPLSLYAPPRAQRRQLGEAVEQGWALVLTPQLRSYCPQHVEQALACSCRTNPDRSHLCVVHAAEAAKLLWSGDLDNLAAVSETARLNETCDVVPLRARAESASEIGDGVFAWRAAA